MKKVLSVVCALALMLCAFPFGIVSAAGTGTEEDPIEIQAIDTIETDGSGNVVYYVYNAPAAGDYTVTITGSMGVDSFGTNMVHPMTGMPMETWAVYGVLNTTATAQMWTMNQIVLPIFDWEAETLSIVIEQAKGTWTTPDTLVIGENTAKNPENDYYYYTWIAEQAGTLTFTMPESNWAYNGYVVDPVTYVPTYFADMDMTSADEAVVNPFSVDVMAGDEVHVQVQTLPDAENWGAVYAGEVVFTVTFDVPTGAQDDPIPVKDGNVVSVGAGETKYFVFTDTPGLTYNFNVSGATGFEVGVEHPYFGMMNNPDVDGTYVGQLMTGNMMSMTPGQASFTITNHTEEAQEYALSIVLPIGTMENPEELVLGETTYVSEDGQPYYYTWTAEDDGTFTFMVNEEQCPAGWEYTIVHGESFESHTSQEGSHFADYSIDVASGDVLSIQVNNYQWAAGEPMVFTTNFTSLPGTQGNPYPVEDGDEVTIGAYETVYFVYTGVPGAIYNLTVTGATGFEAGGVNPMMGFAWFAPDVDGVCETQLETSAMWSMTPGQGVFGIANWTDTEQTYTVSVELPVGTMENPDELVLGETEFVSPDGQNYYYTWTAPSDGTFTFAVNEEACPAGWEYTIVVGEDFVSHTSGEEVPVPSYELAVTAGDVLTVIVNNFDWMPDEVMVFTTSFEGDGEQTLGDMNNDGIIDIADATMVFRAANGRVVLTDEQKAIANVNGDDKVDIADATMLFRYANGRINSFDQPIAE